MGRTLLFHLELGGHLLAMMSSNRWMFFSWMITVLGLAVFGTIEVGTVNEGLSEAQRPGRSVYTISSSGRWDRRILDRWPKMESWCHVYRS